MMREATENEIANITFMKMDSVNNNRVIVGYKDLTVELFDHNLT